MRSVALNATNPFTNLLETYIAKYLPQEEHPTAGSKQYECKQSPLWHPSIYYGYVAPLGYCA